MQKKLLLIANPFSGTGKIKPNLFKIVEIFSNADYSVTVYPTKARADATAKVESLYDGEYDTIVVSGGDGTLNEVITGIMNKKLNCKIGYIPAGTLNEWSSGLGISRDIIKAAKDITTGKGISLDIGKFGDKYFSYTASFGAFTAASYSTPQGVKNVLGQAAYFFEGVKSIGSIKSIPLKLTADGNEIEGKFLFGAISNSMSVGGVVKFNDNLVKLNDGLFEIILIRKPSNLLQLQNIINGILKKDFDRENIEFIHAKEITIESDAEISWTLDGEYAKGKEKIEISNINNAINFIVP